MHSWCFASSSSRLSTIDDLDEWIFPINAYLTFLSKISNTETIAYKKDLQKQKEVRRGKKR